MLTYQYSLNIASNHQEVKLDDLYVSPDLSFVSGTTDNIRICSSEDALWVRSPYFPTDLMTKVTSSKLVKRNGYVLVPKSLQIHTATAYTPILEGNNVSESPEVRYVEYNGNTYFAKNSANNSEYYVIEGNTYVVQDRNPIISNFKEKIYIENDKLTVDGITFNATINNDSELSLSDLSGKYYPIPSSWNVSGVTCNSIWVTKLTVGENVKHVIDCTKVSNYGYQAYIIYDGERKYIEYFCNPDPNIPLEITGAGVIIDGVQYECDALHVVHDYDWEIGYNIYNKNDYYADEGQQPHMTIEDNDYIIYFEPFDILNSGIIGIETDEQHPDILIGDRIIIHSFDNENELHVNDYNDEDKYNGYVYYNSRRYNVIKNLCDSVLLGGVEHELTYEGDCENPYVGQIATCKMNDGSFMNFRVANIQRDLVYESSIYPGTQITLTGFTGNGNMEILGYTGSTPYFVFENSATGNPIPRNNDGSWQVEGGKTYVLAFDGPGPEYSELGAVVYEADNQHNTKSNVTSLEKVKYNELSHQWEVLYSMVDNGGIVTYEPSTNYNVINYDGISIDGYNAKIRRKSIVRDVTPSDADLPVGEEDEYTDNVYYYITTGSMFDYRLKVIDSVGSNIIMCIPDVDSTIYNDKDKFDLVNQILYSTINGNFTIEKRDNTFGNTDLYYDTWMSQAAQSDTATSVYDLAKVDENIRLIIKQAHITLPVGLYTDVSQKLEYEDLITSQYYEEQADMSINKLVDMEKDMYTPAVPIDGENTHTVKTSIDEIVFNLHFRTRDLETWKVISDEGVYVGMDDGTQVLSANYQYCNWFVTDYYPFYDYARDFSGNNWEGTFNKDKFANVITRSDLLGFLYFTTYDVRSSREKLQKSFLRITFFDSKNPNKQNMLGTSTIYFDCDRYLNLLNSYDEEYHYEECVASRNPDRVTELQYNFECQSYASSTYKDITWPLFKKSILNEGFPIAVTFKYATSTEAYLFINDELGNNYGFPIYKNGSQVNSLTSWENGSTLYLVYNNQNPNIHPNGRWDIVLDTKEVNTSRHDLMMFTYNTPNVLTQAFSGNTTGLVENGIDNLYMGDDNAALDSRMVVKSRYEGNSSVSSEGFDMYILKAFANKREAQTIYMKAEFFHAGVGIKVPMVIATDKDNQAISEWSEDKYNDFTQGYDLNSVFDRLYIPIVIEYSRELKKFVYYIKDEDNYSGTILNNDNKWVFNLFELKIKPQ